MATVLAVTKISSIFQHVLVIAKEQECRCKEMKIVYLYLLFIFNVGKSKCKKWIYDLYSERARNPYKINHKK